MAPYPHLPPLMTQLAPQLGQSGVNAARPYYYVGGGSSVVHDLSMQSVQATCSMRLPASTAQQLAAPGVPPLTQLPAASLASAAAAAASAAAAAAAAAPPPPAADPAAPAALMDPFARPRAGLVAEPSAVPLLQPPAFASHAAYCAQTGAQPHWFLPPDGAAAWTQPGAPGASWAPPGAPGAMLAPAATMLPAGCGLPHPSAFAAPAPAPPLPGTAADGGGSGLPGGGLGLGYGGGLATATATATATSRDGGAPLASSAVPLPAAAPTDSPAAALPAGGEAPSSTRLLELQRELQMRDVKREIAAARSPDLELNLSSLAGLAGLSGDRDLQIAGLPALPGLSGLGSAPQGAATDLPPLAVSDDQGGAGQLLPDIFL